MVCPLLACPHLSFSKLRLKMKRKENENDCANENDNDTVTAGEWNETEKRNEVDDENAMAPPSKAKSRIVNIDLNIVFYNVKKNKI